MNPIGINGRCPADYSPTWCVESVKFDWDSVCIKLSDAFDADDCWLELRVDQATLAVWQHAIAAKFTELAHDCPEYQTLMKSCVEQLLHSEMWKTCITEIRER